MNILGGCQNARNMVKICEIRCPRCGKSMECFIRDGLLTVDSICDYCGYTIGAGKNQDELSAPLEDKKAS